MMKNIKTQITLVCITLLSFYAGLAQDYRFGKVSKEEIQQAQHPDDPDADAAVLYRETETKFDYSQGEGFYILTDVFERIKIYNKEGFDWGTRTVNINKGNGSNEKLSGLKGYTYFLQGDKVKEEKLNSDAIFDVEVNEYLEQTKFTMPDLKAGCVIEFKYTLKSPFIGNIDAYRFQERIPVDKVHVKFLTPEYLNYKIHQKGWLPLDIDKTSNSRTMTFTSRGQLSIGAGGTGRAKTEVSNVQFTENIYDINMSSIPALKEEAYAGNIDNYASSVKFELEYTQYPGSTYTNYATTWEAVSKSIHETPSFGAELNKSNYFDKDVDDLLKGVSNEDEKMARIFEFVKNKVAWNSYFGYYTNEGVRSAYKDGKGNSADINLMLVAMLRYAGLNANPILVSTKSNGIPLFPTRNGFNYVIAGVVKDNQAYLLDGTNKNGEINILENEILNWQGRMLMDNGSSAWVSLHPSLPATESALVTMNVNEDLTVSGTMQCRYTGHYALSYREKYANVADEEMRKKLEKNKTETEISNIKFENLKTLSEPVKLSYDFENFDAVEEIGGKLYVSPLAFFAQKENPFKLESRNYPIDFGYSYKDRYLFTINLPEGYKVETLPESTAFGLGEGKGEFRYAISSAGNKIQVSLELAVNEPFVAADYYGNIKKFFELLVEKENEKVVLTKV